MFCKSDFVKIFHLFAAIQFFYALYYEVVYVLPEELKLRKYSFGGKLVYLTFLNGIIQMSFHLIALANEFIGTNETSPSKPPLIRRVRDSVFAAFAFPLAANVTIVFWLLYAIDRELVFPQVLDAFYPSWLNHILHTNIFMFIIIELFISHHNFPKRRNSLIVLSLFLSGYIGWVCFVKYHAGAWVYPVLNVLQYHERICFFAFVALVPIVFYFVGEYVNEKVWSLKVNEKRKLGKFL